MMHSLYLHDVAQHDAAKSWMNEVISVVFMIVIFCSDTSTFTGVVLELVGKEPGCIATSTWKEQICLAIVGISATSYYVRIQT
jgi:hypothetical protein